jgi:hypothetical protein
MAVDLELLAVERDGAPGRTQLLVVEAAVDVEALLGAVVVVEVGRWVGPLPEQVELQLVALVSEAIPLQRLDQLAAHPVAELEIEHVRVVRHRVEVEPLGVEAVVGLRPDVVPERHPRRRQLHAGSVPDVEVAVDLPLRDHEAEEPGLVPEGVVGLLVETPGIVLGDYRAAGLCRHGGLSFSRRRNIYSV